MPPQEQSPRAPEPGAEDSPRPPEPSDAATLEPPADPFRHAEKHRDWAWADLMRRVFDLDVLACPRCGGRMSVIATIEAGDVMRRILDHLGVPTKPPRLLPARPPPRSSDLFSDFPA